MVLAFASFFHAIIQKRVEAKDDIVNNNKRKDLHLFGIYYVLGVREEKEFSSLS